MKFYYDLCIVNNKGLSKNTVWSIDMRSLLLLIESIYHLKSAIELGNEHFLGILIFNFPQNTLTQVRKKIYLSTIWIQFFANIVLFLLTKP